MLFLALVLQAAQGTDQESGQRTGQETGAPSKPAPRVLPEIDTPAPAAVRDEARWIEFEATLITDFSQHIDGGADEGHAALRAQLDVFATIDAAVVGMPGEFLLDLQGIAGDDASTDMGLVQPYSNIDATDDRLQLARVWWEGGDWGVLSLVRIGKMDANDLFALVEPGLHFLHSSMGYSPTVLDFPTYPDSAFGAAAIFEGSSAFDLRLGIFDGSFREGRRTGVHGPSTVLGPPSDLFMLAESGWSWSSDDTNGRAALGVWRHTGDYARYDGGVEQGADGYYATFEQRLLESVAGPTIEWFAQFGASDEQLSPFERHIGLGVVAVHPFSERMDDAFGLGVSRVELPDTPAAGFDRSHETAFEMFYALSPTPALRLQPTLHYIAAPGGRSDLDDAWAATLRIVLTL